MTDGVLRALLGTLTRNSFSPVCPVSTKVEKLPPVPLVSSTGNSTQAPFSRRSICNGVPAARPGNLPLNVTGSYVPTLVGDAVRLG